MVYFISFYINDINFLLQASVFLNSKFAYGVSSFRNLEEAKSIFQDYQSVLTSGKPDDPLVIRQKQRLASVHPFIMGMDVTRDKLLDYTEDTILCKTQEDLLNMPHGLVRMKPEFSRFRVLDIVEWLVGDAVILPDAAPIKIWRMGTMVNFNLN